jgi:hypothetical protein
VDQDGPWRIEVVWDGVTCYVADILGWQLTADPGEARTWPTRLQAAREAGAYARARAWRNEYGGTTVAPVADVGNPGPPARERSPVDIPGAGTAGPWHVSLGGTFICASHSWRSWGMFRAQGDPGRVALGVGGCG